MVSTNKPSDVERGALHVFLELPAQPVRDSLVAEALRALQDAQQTLDPARLREPFTGPIVQRSLERLTAHLAATRDLAARMQAARDAGDTRAEDRLFRAIVIASWLGGALIEELRTSGFDAPLIGIMRFRLEGGKTLELVAQTGHSRAIRLISFSADGARLITAAGDGRAISWVAATGEELHTFWLDSAKVSEPVGVALSPNGRRMVVVGDGRMAIRQPLQDRIFLDESDAVQFAAFSSSGAQLVTSGAETIVWTVGPDTLEKARGFGARGDATASVAALSPRGDLVLTEGANHEAIVWSVGAGTQLQTLSGHAAPLRAAAFSADGARIATLDTSGVVIVWDAHSADRIIDLATTEGPTSIALSPDGGLLLTVPAGAGAQLWELGAQPPAPRAAVARALAGIDGAIVTAALSPSAELRLLVVGTADGALCAVDYDSGDRVWSVGATRLAPTWIEFAADGRRFTVSREDGTEHEWDAESGGLVDVRPATARAPALVLDSIPSGQVIRARESGEVIGYYEPLEDTWGNPLTRVERLASLKRWLLTYEDGQVSVLDEKPSPGQWLFTAEPQWGATIARATATALSPDGRFVLGGTAGGAVELWKVGSAERLCTLLSLSDERWAVADDEGRYDTSHDGQEAGLHWLLELEPIELSQLKLRYYDPTLLSKRMRLRTEPPRTVTRLAPKLFPLVKKALVPSAAGAPTLRVALVDRGGGFGTVSVALNGKEVFVGRPRADWSGGLSLQTDGPYRRIPLEQRRDEATGAVVEISFELPLADHPYLRPGDPDNQVTVVAMDADDVLASRGGVSRFAVSGAEQPTKLWCIIAGISRYQGAGLHLSYAGKDALDFERALRLAGAPLFEDRVNFKVLSTDSVDTAEWPTRANLEAAFRWARAASSGDVLVVYLAGHGVQYNDGNDDDFYYLTQDAVEGALADPVVWRGSTLSSQELTEWIKGVPALKQVLVLDTCHAGRFIADLTDKREVPSSHRRALERMRDRTGLFVLAGSAADAVSYEASRYGQGLLTYALLFYMREERLDEDRYVDINKLCTYAASAVPRLADGIGGVQRPLFGVPEGQPFYIGELDEDRRARIPLAADLQLVARSSFQDEEEMDDVLPLGVSVDEELRCLAAARPAPFVFIEASRAPDALRLAGRYRRAADGSITVTMRLFRDHEGGDKRVVEGRADAVGELAGRVAATAAESIRGAPGPRATAAATSSGARSS